MKISIQQVFLWKVGVCFLVWSFQKLGNGRVTLASVPINQTEVMTYPLVVLQGPGYSSEVGLQSPISHYNQPLSVDTNCHSPGGTPQSNTSHMAPLPGAPQNPAIYPPNQQYPQPVRSLTRWQLSSIWLDWQFITIYGDSRSQLMWKFTLYRCLLTEVVMRLLKN